MLIYGAVLIPVISIILLLIFFKSKMHIAEYLLQLICPIILIFIIKYTGEYSMTDAKEYINGFVLNATHELEWNEYIHKTCSRTIQVSKKKTRTEHYDCSYIEYHPEKYYCENSNGDTFDLSADEYLLAVNCFGNKSKVGHHRGYSVSGDIFNTVFHGQDARLLKTTNIHHYVNKVQASHNVMNFPDINSKQAQELGLFEYPKCILLDTPSILGSGASPEEHQALDLLNARLGASKQIRIWILLYNDKPSVIVQDQINYWKNGNKNELICCIGLKNNQVQWTNVFTWSESDLLRIKIRDKLASQVKLDLLSFAAWLKPEIESGWQRKSFKDFDYLVIDPPFGLIIFTYFATIISCCGIGYFNITNDLGDADNIKHGFYKKNVFRRRKR